MRKVILAITVLIMFAFLSSFATANLTASLSNPRMVLYGNISNGEILTLNNNLLINNNNNFSVDILITPKSIWNSRVLVSESNFSLQAGERKEINYTINLEQAGYYGGDIVVTFLNYEENKQLSLAQELVVIVTDENGKVPGEIKDPYKEQTSTHYCCKLEDKYTLGIAIGIIVILILLLAIIVLARRKNEE